MFVSVSTGSMMGNIFLKYLCFVLVFSACSVPQDKTRFAENALEESLLTLNGQEKSLSEVLSSSRGKQLVLSVWASWCGDCIEGLPALKALQKAAGKNTRFVFLSLDKTPTAWKQSLERYEVLGEHYFLSSGWKGPFCKSIGLDWIPRYMVLDKGGSIVLYKAKTAKDPHLLALLKQGPQTK